MNLLLFLPVLTSGLEVLSGGAAVLTGYASSSSSDAFGLMAVDTRSGEEVWRRTLLTRPLAHDCGLVDLDGDGDIDCIVVGEGALMQALTHHKGKKLNACECKVRNM